MTDSGSDHFGWRYWTVMLLMPFATVFLAMVVYAVVHGYLAVQEPSAAIIEQMPAAMMEALIWFAAILLPQYGVLFRVYPVTLRAVFLRRAPSPSHSVGGVPTILAGLAAFGLGLFLTRLVVADNLFRSSAAYGISLSAIFAGFIIAPAVDLGEAKLRENHGRQ